MKLEIILDDAEVTEALETYLKNEHGLEATTSFEWDCMDDHRGVKVTIYGLLRTHPRGS